MNNYKYTIEGTEQSLTIFFKKKGQDYFAQTTLLPSSLWGQGGSFKTDSIDSANYDALADNLINTKIYPFLREKGKDAVFILTEKNIDNNIQKQPTNTAEAQNNKRQQKQILRNQTATALGLLSIDTAQITKNIPSDKKLNGRDRIISVLISKANELKLLVLPQLTKLIEQMGDGLKCPPPEVLAKIVDIRNKIGTQLNSLAKFLNRTTIIFTALTSFADLLQKILIAKKATKEITKQVARPIPSPPGTPGAVAVTLVEQQASEDRTEDKKNSIISNLGNVSLALSALTGVVTTILDLLNTLDTLLAKCTDAKLVPIDPTLKNIRKFEQEAPDTYKGFSLEIVEIPFNDKIKRKQGLAKNQSGIILLKTNPSFTTTPQILIDELKFTIDTQNLKAY